MKRNELVEGLRELSHEKQLAVIDEVSGWSHLVRVIQRVIQRVIAAILFVIGTIWAVLLLISLFVIVGV
ncbi:MAG: hypothetical protein ABF382_02905 [Akkermansiaceae bacterium]